MSDPNNSDIALDACGCCEGPHVEPSISNRPGLPELRYRIGTHASFFERMIALLSSTAIPDGPNAGSQPLRLLATRAKDDPSIALIDAAAVVDDVLTFYQERIANENYLRTATERRSILEMARAIGYELNPGVAASTILAFTLEDAPGAPKTAFAPKGTRVQSVPPQGKLPQTFETIEEMRMQVDWNALRPRLLQPQVVSPAAHQVFLKGAATNLKVGDRVLVVFRNGNNFDVQPRTVRRVQTRQDQESTFVLFDHDPAEILPYENPNLPAGVIEPGIKLSESTAKSRIVNRKWDNTDLNVFLTINEWNTQDLMDYLDRLRKAGSASENTEVFALREKAGFFGHNAPYYSTLAKADGTAYPKPDWDTNGWQIWHSPLKDAVQYYSQADAYLERPVQGILPESWVMFDKPDLTYRIYRVQYSNERSIVGFAISGKATGLRLKGVNTGLLANNVADKDVSLLVRDTTAFVRSEKLELSELPLLDEINKGDTHLLLDRLVLGLRVGQPVALTGERADAPGIINTEAPLIEAITHIGGYTELTFEAGLQFPYKRETVTLNANVARATHGESVREVLGSGNSSQANQKFVLKRPPLTYVSASTPSGAVVSLEVRVNGILWHQAPSLFGLDGRSQSYVVRIDDDGKAAVIFGDGKQGARLPSGADNVVASYRTGIGLDGEVQTGSLTILQTRPLGIKGVNNPLPATGAAEPQKLADARINAPLTVLTLGRIVSLKDYEDFARQFAGIGKAQAIELWDGETRLSHITIAGANGKPVDLKSALAINLIKAINDFRDPTQQSRVDTFAPLAFNMKARVIIHPDFLAATVMANVTARLKDAFAFSRRAFGQAITSAEVITIIQSCDGVIATDLEELYLANSPAALNQIITASVAHWENNELHKAELLLLNPLGAKLIEVTQ